MPRKPRPDAVLHHLPMEQQKQLSEWLIDGGVGYRAAAELMLSEFEVKTSATAIFDFYHSFCAPELLRRRAVAVSTAEDVIEEAKASPGRWDDAALDQLGQRVFEMMLNPLANAKDTKALFGLVLKARDQNAADEDREIEKRKLALQEQKAKAHDEAKAEMAKLRDPSAGLSDEDRKAIINKVDEILGLKS